MDNKEIEVKTPLINAILKKDTDSMASQIRSLVHAQYLVATSKGTFDKKD